MVYAFYGFLFGFLIPYLSRRFQKFMPATPAYAIYRIFRPNKSVSCAKKNRNPRYKPLIKKYFYRSLVWALISAALSYAVFYRFGSYNIVWYLTFFYILLLLTEVDYKMFLLPDILTVPLIITGFLYSVIVGDWVNPASSSFGAAAGYVIPVTASLFIVWKNKDAFGGGDIKLLTGVGAWLGLNNIVYVILLSCATFAIYALLTKKRAGAFGPAIVFATIIVAFFTNSITIILN